MSENLVECGTHGKSKMAFVCCHLLKGEKVGWNEPDEYIYEEDDDEYDAEYDDCINAWCDNCEEVLARCGGWNDESEAFADIKLVCENCALKFKKANLS